MVGQHGNFYRQLLLSLIWLLEIKWRLEKLISSSGEFHIANIHIFPDFYADNFVGVIRILLFFDSHRPYFKYTLH